MIVKRSGTDFSLCFSLRRRIDRIDTIHKMERPLSDYLVNESCKSCLVSSRVLKNYFGVRRLVAAFKSDQSEFQKPEENSSCVHSDDKSPHSKLAMRLSRAEFFSTLLEYQL